MAEDPYENLDIGYFEMPLPNTEEFTVIRFLTKTGVARLWDKIKNKFVKIPSGGITGQALIKGENGIVWGNSLPSGGVAGQYLTKTDDGSAWKTLDNASSTMYGITIFKSNEDFCSFFNIEYKPSDFEDSDVYIPCSLSQLKVLSNNLQITSDFDKKYTKLEYVGTTGTQYIDTGYIPSCSTTFDAILDIANVSTGHVFGSDADWQKRGFNLMANISCYGTKTYSYNYSGDKVHILLDKNRWYKNGNLVTVFSDENFVCPTTLTIGCLNRNGNKLEYSSTNIYSFKISEGPTIKHDFIPVKENSSGDIGLYDNVTQTFHTNSGTGSLVAGPEV